MVIGAPRRRNGHTWVFICHERKEREARIRSRHLIPCWAMQKSIASMTEEGPYGRHMIVSKVLISSGVIQGRCFVDWRASATYWKRHATRCPRHQIWPSLVGSWTVANTKQQAFQLMVELGYVEGKQIRSFRNQTWKKGKCTLYEHRYTDVFGSCVVFLLSTAFEGVQGWFCYNFGVESFSSFTLQRIWY
jgi:hypothetical protein